MQIFQILFKGSHFIYFNSPSVQHSGRYSVFKCNRHLRKKKNRKLLWDKWRWIWEVRSHWWCVESCIEGIEQVAYIGLLSRTYITVKIFLFQLIGSIFLSRLGTMAAFRPYGKCQSRISSYCLQWLYFSQMDENSSYDVYLYRLHFITLYRDPD